jgi:hypothetical protein
MISELVLATWVGLGAYIIWFFTSAKDYAALTSRETTILWKLHKKQTNCSSTKFETVRRKNRIVGFRCDCGYKYLSKRPIAQRDLRAQALKISRENGYTYTPQEELVYLERYE